VTVPRGGWDPGEYERLAAIAVAAVARHVAESQSGDVPVGSPAPLPELIQRLELRSLIRDGGLEPERFEPWLERMLEHSVRLHHPAQIDECKREILQKRFEPELPILVIVALA